MNEAGKIIIDTAVAVTIVVFLSLLVSLAVASIGLERDYNKPKREERKRRREERKFHDPLRQQLPDGTFSARHKGQVFGRGKPPTKAPPPVPTNRDITVHVNGKPVRATLVEVNVCSPGLPHTCAVLRVKD